MKLSTELITQFMAEALAEARLAEASGEVPVGAVIAVNGKIVAQAHNRVEELCDPTAHAEVLAIRAAGDRIKNWRLSDAVLVVTLEPCTMCAGAILGSRVATVVFGAADPKAGALGSLFDLTADKRIGSEPRVIRGVQEEESSRLLRNFFAGRR